MEKTSVSPAATTAPIDDNYYRLLKDLQMHDFALLELSLFLNTHPADMPSLQQFNQLVQKRQRIAANFEQLYGPLLQYGHSYSKFPWQWAQSPWPWQV